MVLPSALEGLEPAGLWKYFGALTQLPRPSKHEGKVLEYLKAFAEERGLAWQQVCCASGVRSHPQAEHCVLHSPARPSA